MMSEACKIKDKNRFNPYKNEITNKEEISTITSNNFEQNVFKYLFDEYSGAKNRIYKLKNCRCDGLLELNEKLILLEMKGGINGQWDRFAICQLIEGKYFLKEAWNYDVEEGWIVFGEFIKSNWTRNKNLNPARYPLETINNINETLSGLLKIRLFQHKNNELIELVTTREESN